VLVPWPVSGTAIAITLLIVAEAAETWYLHHRRRQFVSAPTLPATGPPR
jgi:hypothetical protein